MPESIIAAMNKILEVQGGVYAQVLADGINIGVVLGSMGSKAATECEGA